MKILIIGIPRTGSTSLWSNIINLGYSGLMEPYRRYNHNYLKYPYPLDISKNEKVVVKHLIHDIPRKKYIGNMSDIDICKEMSEQFDKTIILDRRNSQEMLESYIGLYYNLDNNMDIHSSWEFSNIPKEYVNQFILDNKHKLIYDFKTKIQTLSTLLSIPITYYEDLYGEDRELSLNIIKSWKLDIDEERLNDTLNPLNRYRLFQKKSII